MAQKRKRKNKRWLEIALFLVLLIVAGIVCYLVWDNYFRDEEGTNDVPQEITVEEEIETPEQEIEIVQKEEIKQYEGEDPNEASDLTGVVTYTGVVSGELVIRVNIDQYLVSGRCELALSRDGVIIYNDVAEIVDSAATATCAGFNIPSADLGNGETEIRIILDADGKKGTIIGRVEL